MQKSCIDQMKREVKFSFPPQRIVSLVPSQTELLVDLGLETELVGITNYCIHPKHLKSTKTKVGGTKKVNIDKVRHLKPCLIIANKEENQREDIEALAKEFPVWISDVHNKKQAFEMIKGIGEICNRVEEAEKMVSKIQHQFAQIVVSKPMKKAIYLIWNKPLMSVNKNTFIHEMLQTAGFENCLAESAERYPEITEKTIAESQAEYILLSSEPYPFAEKHLADFQEKFPKQKVILVDGEMFSWYGSRLQYFSF